jgi:hypothetical protein
MRQRGGVEFPLDRSLQQQNSWHIPRLDLRRRLVARERDPTALNPKGSCNWFGCGYAAMR